MAAGMSNRVGFGFFPVGKWRRIYSFATCAWTNVQWEEKQSVVLSKPSQF